MRFDKPRYFRQSMSWVHTWTGLVMGWLLFAVYVTGALSYFRNEITVWMQPELHAAAADEEWLPKAVGLLAEKGANAQQWTIIPPGPRSPVVTLAYRESAQGNAAQSGRGAEGRASDAGAARPNMTSEGQSAGSPDMQAQTVGGEAVSGGQGRNQGVKRLAMDPSTGSVLEPRSTAGGNFLYRFHFQLHGMDRATGQWIVGIATMLMLIAIVTGVIVHRNIFKDFFTFRPSKGKRSWLDGHNATGVLSLPFHIVITFSGLLLLGTQLMPWAADAAYKGDRRAFQQEMRGGAAGRETSPGGAGNSRGANAGSAQATLTDLRPLYLRAQQQWPRQGVGSITVNAPGSARPSIEIRQAFGERLTARGGSERMLFDGVSGEVLDVPVTPPPSMTRSIWNALIAVHEGRFAMPVVRWLLFLSGVLGSAMIASGLVLWLVSRQKEREASGCLPRGHRFVEIMNVGGMAGLMLAIAAYFWANRFIPADLAGRNALEIQSFFGVWGLSFVHAMWRRHKRAWVEQLSLGAALFLLVPLLNGLTGGAHLGQSLLRGQWQVASFDLAASVTGVLMLFIAHRLHGYVPKPSRKVMGNVGRDADSGASVAVTEST